MEKRIDKAENVGMGIGSNVKAAPLKRQDGADEQYLALRQIDAMLNTIPIELTFVDENDVNKYFNDGDDIKLFKRPLTALDREVYTCHPPKFEPMGFAEKHFSH
ncbi:MAG: PAS domain-containing protein [Pseudobutyrivibrio sp.]|nr:PAS domain-containing protein [Pseudobutyrivibrio sp.]